jgi:hypothetical protein
MKQTNEPDQLLRGKIFHERIQRDWLKNAQGKVKAERTILKKNQRKGRVDVFVDDDDLEGVAAIVEIKASEWEKMTEQAIRKNIRRQIKQIWDYIESQILDGQYVATGVRKDISPGIIFHRRPKNENLLKLIEESFEDEGITVVWEDESIEERKKRSTLLDKINSMVNI